MQDFPLPDRRRGQDRRNRPTSPFTRTSLFGARGHFRRDSDKKRLRFVDRYSWRAAGTVIAVILLSVADASFTLKLVAIGAASEVNPVMDFFLDWGAIPFLLFKYALTAVGLLTFLILKNFTYLSGKIKVSAIMAGILFLYAVLIVYELSLFHRFETEMLLH